MAGSNPYVKTSDLPKPEKPFKVTYLPEGTVLEIDPSALPPHGMGLRGSILDLALDAGIEIDHACGGVCACSTCHVIVQEGIESCNDSSEAEEDQLEKAPGITTRSRLACQCVPNGEKNLVIQIPSWNRNLVRE